jgi:hypothetical protein
MTQHRASASRRIAAPAGDIFRIVADPKGHVAIDGSGMLVAAPDSAPLTEVGQTFEMDMDRRPLGDIPNMAEYQVVNTVTALVQDRLVEWAPSGKGRQGSGNRWGWQLEPVGDGETDVTNYTDWSNTSEEARASGRFPVVPVSMFERSLDRLAEVVAAGPPA